MKHSGMTLIELLVVLSVALVLLGLSAAGWAAARSYSVRKGHEIANTMTGLSTRLLEGN